MLRLSIGILALVLGCAARPPVSAGNPPAAPKIANVAAATPAAPAQGPAIEARPELARFFEAEHVKGAIALYDSADGRLRCSDVERCEQRAIPASTFKIPNALIGIELGLLEDSESPMPWDGVEREMTDWNQDHTLRSAIRVSCVPCFQALARSIGPDRMRDFLNRFEYGNRDISGRIEQFWLTGSLRISPLEQIDFLRRLDGGKLPVRPESLEVLREVLTLDVGPNHVFRGKTGLAGKSPRPTAWFIGWVELGERRVFFATLIDEIALDVDVAPLRRRLTETILRSLDALPS